MAPKFFQNALTSLSLSKFVLFEGVRTHHRLSNKSAKPDSGPHRLDSAACQFWQPIVFGDVVFRAEQPAGTARKF